MRGTFRKSAISLAVLFLAGSASAGTVTGFFVGGEGVDLQPRNGDLDFVTVFPATTPGIVDTTAIHPTYGWGWRLYAGLNFCNNEDLTISWLDLRSFNTNDFGTPNGIYGTSTSVVRWIDESTWLTISGDVNFRLDDVYGVFGHTVNMGPWSVRFAGGVEWTKLRSDMTVAAIEPNGGLQPSGVTVSYEDESKMTGVGPRAEFDFTYHLPMNFSVFARPSVALLIATRRTELENLTVTTTPADNIDDFDFTHRYVVVPKVGIKLGIGYSYSFGGVGGEGGGVIDASTFTIEAGWQTDTYIHAIERSEGFDNLGVNDFAASNSITKVSNFGIQGFFVGAKLTMDV